MTSTIAVSNTPNRKANDLPIRLLGAALFVVPFIAFAWLGGWWFTGFILSAVGITTHELIGLLRRSKHAPSRVIMALAGLIAFAYVRMPGLPFLLTATALSLLGSLAWQLRNPIDRPLSDWALAIAGGAYLGLTGGHLAAVREFPNGLWWLTLTCAATWITDSGAYFVGRRFGRHKLSPRISPGKSVEGYLGGLVTATVAGALIGQFSPLGIVVGIAGGLLVGALSVLGDLIESLFKRQANIKDSGTLIPGHGGVFDRIDSLLWAGVIIYHLYIVTTFLH